MANAFTRSWDVTKTTFHVMRQDKELFIYPILAGITSIIFIVAMLFPSLLVLIAGGNDLAGALQYVLLFVLYFGLSFLTIFFNTCVVYTAKTRFEGGDATLGSSFKFAFSRIGAITLWSLVSATVGLILRAIEQLARNMKGVGGLIVSIIRSLLGMAWAIITVFVIPSIVYKGSGPFAAIKDSVQVLKKTWGESLIRYFGLGFAQGVLTILGVIILAPLLIIGFLVGSFPLLIIGILVLVLWVGLMVLIFGIANSVFNTALYVYGTTGKVPTGYNPEHMQQAFKPEKLKSANPADN